VTRLAKKKKPTKKADEGTEDPASGAGRISISMGYCANQNDEKSGLY
jgi:hypothetical protein